MCTGPHFTVHIFHFFFFFFFPLPYIIVLGYRTCFLIAVSDILLTPLSLFTYCRNKCIGTLYHSTHVILYRMEIHGEHIAAAKQVFKSDIARRWSRWGPKIVVIFDHSLTNKGKKKVEKWSRSRVHRWLTKIPIHVMHGNKNQNLPHGDELCCDFRRINEWICTAGVTAVVTVVVRMLMRISSRPWAMGGSVRFLTKTRWNGTHLCVIRNQKWQMYSCGIDRFYGRIAQPVLLIVHISQIQVCVFKM
jgi:hypothetical protein